MDSPYERMVAHPFKWFAERMLIMGMCGIAAGMGVMFGAWSMIYVCAYNGPPL